MPNSNVLFIADSDSQLRPAYLVATRLAERLGGATFGNLVPSKTRISRRQISNAQVQVPLTFDSLEAVIEKGATEFAAIVVFLPGSRLLRFRLALEAKLRSLNCQRRPILVTGYNGVVYEQHLAGILWRIGYDVVCINSRADEDLFKKQLALLDVESSPLVRSGLMLAQGKAQQLERALGRCEDGAPSGVLFACQAIVPEAQEERVYLLSRLRDYALTHPERDVYVKPRTLPTEDTFHEQPNHYESLFRQEFAGHEIPNLHFAYGSFQDTLKKVDLVVTVSSTALMEGLASGVPGVVLTDCGIKESYGNHFYVGSGMLTTFDRLLVDELPTANRSWLNDNGFDPEDNLSACSTRVVELIEAQRGSEVLLPFQVPYYTRETAPYIYRRFLPKDSPKAKQTSVSGIELRRRKLRKLVANPEAFVRDGIRNQASRVGKLLSRKRESN